MAYAGDFLRSVFTVNVKFDETAKHDEVLAKRDIAVNFFDARDIFLGTDATQTFRAASAEEGRMQLTLRDVPPNAVKYQVHVVGDPTYARYVVYNTSSLPFSTLGSFGLAGVEEPTFVVALVRAMSLGPTLVSNFLIVPALLLGLSKHLPAAQSP